jgi:hypothetical protein
MKAFLVNKRTIRYAIIGCIGGLAAVVVYAMVRLYVLHQRVDASIFVANVILFAAIAAFLIYLTKKQMDIEEEELFKD